MMKFISTFMGALALLLSSIAWAAGVNVNKAGADELAAELSGVGKTIAERIVEERRANGPFKDSADLVARVKGVGPAVIERNGEQLKFSD